jgi:formate dehydrogenase major subunit
MFIKQVIKALIDAGCTPKNADGFDELKDSLSSINVTYDAKALADDYRTSKKAMILYALGGLTTSAATELANMAVIAGHIGSPRDGIYVMRQMAGSQILADYKIAETAEAAKGAKGLMVFGEDPEALPDDLKFLMVQDIDLTKTAMKADVVFPLAAYPEIDGTFVNTERRVQYCAKAVDPPMEYRTSEIAQKIAEVLEGSAPAGVIRELYPKAKLSRSEDPPILYADGFGFPDKKAKLQVVGETAMFDELKLKCSLLKAIEADLPQPV